jgi:beta-glucanase (GH16 family)
MRLIFAGKGNCDMKRSLLILMIVLGCLLIGMMEYIDWVNQSSRDNFDNLDEGIWAVSNKTLGRSRLSPTNVEVKDGYLNIKMPANTLEGGEFIKQESSTYGSYETRMKLPEAPSSITGFFLYAAPDYFYEIDIEIHNSTEGKLLLTTYADGAVKNEYVGELGFDPTADFHTYRFDYTADQLVFYVDNKLIMEWQEGFPVGQPMQLMVNSWYPNWLEGTPPPADQFLLVDWIRY